jgi:hypothetical protein
MRYQPFVRLGSYPLIRRLFRITHLLLTYVINNHTEEPTITEDQTNNEPQRQETDQENILVEAETPSTSVLNVRKRGGNIATVLTSEENRQKRKELDTKKKNIIAKRENKKKKTPLKRKRSCSSSTSSDEIILNDSSDTDNNEEAADYENECVGCKEDYRKTKKTEYWIKCTICGRWMHEGCTTYTDLCQQCGKHGRKKKY